MRSPRETAQDLKWTRDRAPTIHGHRRAATTHPPAACRSPETAFLAMDVPPMGDMGAYLLPTFGPIARTRGRRQLARPLNDILPFTAARTVFHATRASMPIAAARAPEIGLRSWSAGSIHRRASSGLTPAAIHARRILFPRARMPYTRPRWEDLAIPATSNRAMQPRYGDRQLKDFPKRAKARKEQGNGALHGLRPISKSAAQWGEKPQCAGSIPMGDGHDPDRHHRRRAGPPETAYCPLARRPFGIFPPERVQRPQGVRRRSPPVSAPGCSASNSDRRRRVERRRANSQEVEGNRGRGAGTSAES